MKGGVYGIFS